MKNIIIIICLLGLSLQAHGAGSQQGNIAGIKEGINAGANGAFAAGKIPPCSKGNGGACAQAAAGFLQLVKSLMDMMGSMGGRDALAPDFDWSNPDFGDDFGTVPTADQDYLDPIIDTIESGKYDDYKNAYDKLMGKADSIEKALKDAGYTVDKESGTMTDAAGNKTDLSSIGIDGAGNIDKYNDMAKAALDLSGGGGMIAADGGGDGGRGVAGLDSGLDGIGSGSGVNDFLKKLKDGKLDDSKLSGMSKTTSDGDKIGIAMNNIFKMIQIKYTSIDKNQEFMNK